MEKINCPMCGKPNPGEAEECEHCGARLKPLEVGGSSEDSEKWLDRMREDVGEAPTSSEMGGEAVNEPDDTSSEGPDDLDFDKLRAEQTEEKLPQEAEPAKEDVPEWLQRIREKKAEEPKDLVESNEPAPEQALRAAAPPADEVGSETAGPAPEEELRPGSEAEPEPESPDWLEEAEDKGALAEEEKDAEPEAALPHVPALIAGAEKPPEAELGDLGLPDWLGEIEPLEDEEPEGSAPDLARATLPNWLEAMRPVDTFRSVVEIASEDDQAVESVGPLAGLSGVLLAEPIVAMPRTSSVGSMQLDVSERQYAQAELLQRLVEEEEQEAPAKPKRRARLAIYRWAIAAVILLAVSLPIVTGEPSFALPSLEPRELGALFNLVEQLPAERPVLVVFEYEPGNAGELEAVSGALLDQMMARGLLLASLSTRPTGPALAKRAMDPYAERHGYQDGLGIVHLGYLSGGPTAVQLFAASPRDAVLKGFALPEQVRESGLTAWDTVVLERVQALSDFGMVAVITADSESARVWTEQARPYMGDTPLVVVLSAGAEPLIRPYFESDDPKISGILSGLPAAAAYELRNGRLGLAQARWDAFGTAMLAAEIVLLAGIGYGLLNLWRGRSLA
ncbi:MAG: hypothetical protein J4N91_06650 [Chloroflexi bacterium]|nr:hypothetical protein [Chloroflexota bacterium]MCI0854093.1 hypothetical protein [Chloroflexota bacterium]